MCFVCIAACVAIQMFSLEISFQQGGVVILSKCDAEHLLYSDVYAFAVGVFGSVIGCHGKQHLIITRSH